MKVQKFPSDRTVLATSSAAIANIDTAGGRLIPVVMIDATGPLFIQLLAVVPSARRRGAGLAMLSAAAGREPRRNIAMATLDDNTAAHNLNERFSKSIGGKIHRVPVHTFWRTDLGFAEGEKHRPWLIERP